jgi:hypothetical protein
MGQGPVWGILLCCLVGVVTSLCVPGFVRSGPSKTAGIAYNLRQLDTAIQQWALDHGRTGGVAVTKEDVAPYLKRLSNPNGWVKPVAGERYILRTVGESPEANLTRECNGRPKGTVFRLGTNANLEITPPNRT